MTTKKLAITREINRANSIKENFHEILSQLTGYLF